MLTIYWGGNGDMPHNTGVIEGPGAGVRVWYIGEIWGRTHLSNNQ